MEDRQIQNFSYHLRLLRGLLDLYQFRLRHETTSYEQFTKHLNTIADFYFPRRDQENP